MNKLQKQRARLIREAEALRTGDGFADDAARLAFDAKTRSCTSAPASRTRCCTGCTRGNATTKQGSS
jgi:hypothetical protein